MAQARETLPPVVSDAEWRKARAGLLTKEKAATRARDALAAERRRLPMVEIGKDYRFESEGGSVRLVDLFEGRRQLVMIHFMFAPDDEEACVGCSMTVDSVCNTAHLHARDVTIAAVSRAPIGKLLAFRRRMGWTLPWYSSFGSDFNPDFGTTKEGREISAVSVFLRDGGKVFRTYVTSNRGDEMLGSVWSYLDITPFGRQESWEDTPPGRPQSAPYGWWRHHDRYEAGMDAPACHRA